MAMNRRSALKWGLSACSSAWACGQAPQALALTSPGKSTQEVLQALVNDPQRAVTGVAIRLRIAQRTLISAQAGWAHLGAAHPRDSVPLVADSLFRIASISKVAVALIQARLHEAGKLNWDADLSGLLTHPKFEKLPITPRLLLTHRSGLRDSDTWPQFHAQGLADVLKLTPTWSEHPPGAKFAYCNLGFVVLATAMERACGERFDAIAKRWLFDPLRMKARFHPSGLDAHSKAHLATLYRMRQGQWVAQVDAREGPWTTVPDIEPGLNAAAFSPQGGLRIGMEDLMSLGQCLWDRGRWDGQSFISESTMQEMFRPQWQWSPLSDEDTDDGLFRSWGLGLQRFTDQRDAKGGDRLHRLGGWQAVGHLGLAYGLYSGLLVQPRREGHPGWSLAYVISGTSVPESQARGQHSSFTVWEETLLGTMLDRLIDEGIART